MSNIEKIRQEIERRRDFFYERYMQKGIGCIEETRYDECVEILSFIDSLPDCTVKTDGQGRVKDDVYDSLPEEKPSEDFPTSDEEMAKFLATHPKVEVPEKYKTPNWLFDKQPSEDLEEAAEKYADKHGFRVPYDGSNNYYDDVDVKASKEGFIAGAEWMRKKDVEDMYMSDNRHFLKCYEQGKVDMKEQMMKDAVEAKIYGYDDGSFELIASWLDMPKESKFKDGDKVKVIIVKK